MTNEHDHKIEHKQLVPRDYATEQQSFNRALDTGEIDTRESLARQRAPMVTKEGSARPNTVWVGPTVNRTVAPTTIPRRIAIHSMGGYYQGSIEWNKRADVEASAHFYIRSKDGLIGQLVRENE